MLKRFCDICGKEMERFPLQKAVPIGRNSVIEIKLTGNALTQEDICKYCIIDAVRKLDDRGAVQKAKEGRANG